MNKRYILLLAASFIWGSAFIAQKSASTLNPLVFLACRYIVAVIFLTPIILSKLKKRNSPIGKKNWLKPGAICGILLFIALLVQQTGINATSVGKAGFITSLYMVIIPLIYLLFGKKFDYRLVVSIALAVIGIFNISKIDKGDINHGDFIVLLSSVFFALHIISVGYFSKKIDGFLLAFGQMLAGAILSWAAILFGFVEFNASEIQTVLPSILYAGVMSSGVAYTLAVLGQKGVNPIVASLILSLESVFAAIAGVVILGEGMILQEIIGCILVFSSVIVAQLIDTKK